MEKEKIDLIIGKNTKSFFIEKSAEKKNLQIVKVSGKIQQIIKFKMFFFFSIIGRKRKTEKNTVDFYNTRGQQSFLYNSINWIEIKIENDTVKNMTEKYKKNQAKFTLEGLLFSSSVQNDTEKIFITTAGLLDAKFSLIHGKIHQAIGVINLNEIDDWETI